MITTEKKYNETLQKIDALMKKGEENLTENQFEQLAKMAKEVETYEQQHIILPAPETICEMVEMKLFERRMTQTEFAKRSGLGLPKVNQILKGKRSIDVAFLKAVYTLLGIPADFLLSRI